MKYSTVLLVAAVLLWPAIAAADETAEDVQARLAREENAQKRAQRMADRAVRELAELLRQIQSHRLKPTGELLSADQVHQSLRTINAEHIPQVEKGLYAARTGSELTVRVAALADAARRQEELVSQLQQLLAQLQRSAATGACLHRAERILRDQVRLNGETKTSLRDGFGRAVADLADSLRRRLLAQAEEQTRLGRELVLLDGELAAAEQSGPATQRAGIQAARKILADKKLAMLTQQVSEQLAANNAAAATGGAELETHLRALVAALHTATAGAGPIAPFDLLGPSLAELAAKDKELQALLEKLKAMIREAELLKKTPEKEELRRLANLQEELNNMLVEINRNLPELDDAELIARLKEMLANALAAMAAAGEGIGRGDGEDILRELKVTLSHLVLAEAELQALLATLAALQAGQNQDANSNARETPAGIALGLGLRLGGNTTGASGPGGVLNPNKTARQLGPQDWGRLPPAIREQLLQAVRESFPQEYEDLIELYFQNIAKGASNGK